MRPLRGLLLAPLALVTAAGGARAADLSVTVTESLLTEYRGDNGNGVEGDDEYGIGVNRLNVVGASGPLSASLRADTVVFVDRPGGAFRNDARLERVSAAYRVGTIDLEGGDLYRQLGRGLVLAVRKLDEVGVDTTIRGGQLRWRSGAFSAALFGGQANPSNLDGVGQKHVRDTLDDLAGFELEWKVDRRLVFSTFGAYVEPTERILGDELDRTAAAGAAFETRSAEDALVVYGEAAFQRRALAGVEEDGRAAYLAADVTLTEDVSLLLEALWLADFEMRGSTNSALGSRFEYNRPPTLERVDQEVFNNRDTRGGRVRIQWVVPETLLTLYANGMMRQNDPGAAQVDQVHAYGGFEYEYEEGESHLHASSGWRDESRDAAGGGRERVKGMTHFEGDWLQRLAAGLSLHVQTTNELRILADDRYARGSLLAGVDVASLGGLTFEYGYDTQDETAGARNHFFAGLLAWHATDRVQLRATGGTQRGGLKCVAGVCRIFPEFAGARLEVAARF